MPLLFVYGTLQRGQRNHTALTGQRFVAPATTPPGWTLHDLGGFPGLVAAPADRHGVHGELWEVDACTLARLDRLERVDEGLYERRTISLATPTGIMAEAYIYPHLPLGRRALGSRWPETPPPCPASAPL